MRTIVYCPHCGYVGSLEQGDVIPVCPDCAGDQLFDTGYARDRWVMQNEQVKATLKMQWRESLRKMPVNEVRDRESVQYLVRIAEDTKKISFWVRFWSILMILEAVAIILLIWGIRH